MCYNNLRFRQAARVAAIIWPAIAPFVYLGKMSEFREYKLLEKRLVELEREFERTQADMHTLKSDNAGFRADLTRYVFMLIGDDELNLPGLVERMIAVEKDLKLLQKAQDRDDRQSRIVFVGLLVTAATGLVTLLAVIILLARFV